MKQLFKHNQLFRFIGWFFLANGLIFLLLGLNYLRTILASESLFNNAVIDYSNYYTGKILVLSFVLATYLSYMMLLGFVSSVCVFLSACLVPSKRFIGLLSVVIATASVTCLLVDSRVYSMFKFHLTAHYYHSQLVLNGVKCLISRNMNCS